MKPSFQFYPSKQEISRGVLSIPHSGEEIPSSFEPFLTQDATARRRDVDFRVFDLVDIKSLQAAGVDVYVAQIHRYVIDLNRPRDQAFFHWKKTSQDEEIVVKLPTTGDQAQALRDFYDPYHEALQLNLESNPRRFIDLHSMPSKPTAFHLKKNPDQKASRPPFCLSNQGMYLGLKQPTAGPSVLKSLQSRFLKRDYRALLNDPYKGGFLTESMASVATESIQIETNRSLYMQEDRFEMKLQEVQTLREDLTAILMEHFS